MALILLAVIWRGLLRILVRCSFCGDGLMAGHTSWEHHNIPRGLGSSCADDYVEDMAICQRLGYLTLLDLGSGKHEFTDHIYIVNLS